ncbi:MAG: hypothetical protein B6226_02705 [Candidatus Cloacimonetes bacterium 4572_65]|nr:MAG: hypothetical protein B6226_02705 [Candidatus Cloacimonetes bacterium 4572_65]
MDFILAKFNHLKEKNHLEAVNLMKNALIEDSNNFEYRVAFGTFLCEEMDKEEGLEQLIIAESLGELTSLTLFLMATSYLRLKEYEIAITYYERAEDDIPEAMFNIALTYTKLGDRTEAVVKLKELRKNKLYTTLAQEYIIEIYLSEFRLNKVEQELKYYIKHIGETDKYHQLSGFFYFYSEINFLAVKSFFKLAGSSIPIEHYYSPLGKALMKVGKSDRALYYLRTNWLSTPGDYYKTVSLGECYLELKEYENAIAIAEVYIENTDDDPPQNIRPLVSRAKMALEKR